MGLLKNPSFFILMTIPKGMDGKIRQRKVKFGAARKWRDGVLSAKHGEQAAGIEKISAR